MYPYNINNYTPAQQVIRVTGENGARAYSMAPNSSALLLDETNPIVWFKQTDGAGYPTLTAYKIESYHPDPLPDLNDVLARIKKLEEKVNESNTTGNDK